jgi:glycogen synthase
MKILIYSPAFLPKIGGLELNQHELADQFTRLGHQVTVVTTTPPAGADRYPFRVVRQPGPAALLREVSACDVYFQANVSLRGLWPLLFVRRPWAVSHHSWYCRSDGRVAWQDRLKRYLLRFAAASISVSKAIADDLGTKSEVIENAYRDDLFHRLPGVARDRDLAFLGRLVSDKGIDLLIAALGGLAAAGLRPRLTIIGDGPERDALLRQAAQLGIAGQIELTGLRTDDKLVRLLNQHRILVVPSRYNEPFGIVALEGIACGCLVVGSAGGGLAEAIGPCGRTFPNGNVEALTAILAELLVRPGGWELPAAVAQAHLAPHRSEAVARRYLAALEAAVTAHREAHRPRQRRPARTAR